MYEPACELERRIEKQSTADTAILKWCFACSLHSPPVRVLTVAVFNSCCCEIHQSVISSQVTDSKMRFSSLLLNIVNTRS